jgi:hypothetical protein
MTIPAVQFITKERNIQGEKYEGSANGRIIHYLSELQTKDTTDHSMSTAILNGKASLAQTKGSATYFLSVTGS